jgi:two-component system, OmpR family, sensor histidine kinase TctE
MIDSATRSPSGTTWSLRRQLLVGILVPVLALVALNAVFLYQQALKAADTAYDRTLLASAKSLGEMLTVRQAGDGPRLEASMLYSALEAFEADNRSRLFYRVRGFDGEHVSGFQDLPAWRGDLPAQGPYAALVDFYDDRYRGEAVRVAVLLQPVVGLDGLGMATIQVAETLELRHTLARQVLVDTLWRQALLVGVIALVVVWVVQRVTRPVRALSAQITHRDAANLDSIEVPDAPRELSPLIDATNQVMTRLRALLDDQKRFVRDASHQLRTPLAVLKTQVQSALRGDVAPTVALGEINATVDRATELANQMLALAKVAQLRQAVQHGEAQPIGSPAPVEDWSAIVRDVALDLAPLMVAQRIDFEIDTHPVWVQSHVWPLRELTRNLLHNAIRFTPPGAALRVRVGPVADPGASPGSPPRARLSVHDCGPGLTPQQQERLFIPFAASSPPPSSATGPLSPGSGLGLAICHGIVESLGGEIGLHNRFDGDRVAGLDAVVTLPIDAALQTGPDPASRPGPASTAGARSTTHPAEPLHAA